jgi:hypothetical protein
MQSPSTKPAGNDLEFRPQNLWLDTPSPRRYLPLMPSSELGFTPIAEKSAAPGPRVRLGKAGEAPEAGRRTH